MRLVITAILSTVAACGSTTAPDNTVHCDQLASQAQAAASAFPSSWATCSQDSDCTILTTAALCVPNCGAPVASAHADDLQRFLDSDPTVTATCDAYTAAGQDGKCSELPLECPVMRPKCDAGTCSTFTP